MEISKITTKHTEKAKLFLWLCLAWHCMRIPSALSSTLSINADDATRRRAPSDASRRSPPSHPSLPPQLFPLLRRILPLPTLRDYG